MYLRIYGYMKVINDTRVITTVKVNHQLYDQFKVHNVKSKFYLQDLVNRCMYLYMHDEQFRSQIYNFQLPILDISGSFTLSITGSSN